MLFIYLNLFLVNLKYRYNINLFHVKVNTSVKFNYIIIIKYYRKDLQWFNEAASIIVITTKTDKI